MCIILNCDNWYYWILQNSNWHFDIKRIKEDDSHSTDFWQPLLFTWRKDLNSQRDLNLLGLLSMITQTGFPQPLNTGNLKLAEVPGVAKVYIIIINQSYSRRLTAICYILWFWLICPTLPGFILLLIVIVTLIIYPRAWNDYNYYYFSRSAQRCPWIFKNVIFFWGFITIHVSKSSLKCHTICVNMCQL